MSDLPTAVRAPDQKFCVSCARVLHVTAVSCPACGALQQVLPAPQGLMNAQQNGSALQKSADQKFCGACGQVIHQTAFTCPKCGAMQPGSPIAARKSRNAAAILAILLGGIGVHKFYLGKVWMGFLYLIFFWTYVPALVALIEGIWYLTLSEEAFEVRVVRSGA